MTSLLSRIRKRISIMAASFQQDCRFSYKLAYYRVMDDICSRIGLQKTSSRYHAKKDAWILDFLEEQLQSVFKQFADDNDEGIYQENAPIWICWWTGENTMPPLVQKCVESIRKNADEHSVNYISKDTYNHFLTIPQYILDGVASHRIGLAHLADYIRVSLLSLYGGIWLDATIFCSAELPAVFWSLPFFTCKSKESKSCRYLSQMRWTTFVLGGWQNNVVYRYLKQAFEHYWSINSNAVDYLFFDYIIELGYRQIPSVRNMIDAVPYNNLHRDDLQAAMNAALPAEQWKNIVNTNTVLYKLSWRETYLPKTADGKDSIFTYFLSY